MATSKATHQLVATDGSATFTLKPWKRPQKVEKTFKIKISGKNVEVVATKGLKYTYLNTEQSGDCYVDGLLTEGGSYKVQPIPVAASAAA